MVCVVQGCACGFKEDSCLCIKQTFMDVLTKMLWLANKPLSYTFGYNNEYRIIGSLGQVLAHFVLSMNILIKVDNKRNVFDAKNRKFVG